MPTDDDEAIRRCRAGDVGGLDPLMMRYQVSTLRLAYLLTGDRSQAEDVVQDSFIQAFRAMGQFRLGQPFAPWLHRIVTNTARQRRRGTARRREVSLTTLGTTDDPTRAARAWAEPIVSAVTSDPVSEAERGEERTALFKALEVLSRKQREAVVLRFYYDYTDAEMAQVLSCREGAARQRLHAGLRSLERIIRGRYGWLLTVEPTARLSPKERSTHHA